MKKMLCVFAAAAMLLCSCDTGVKTRKEASGEAEGLDNTISVSVGESQSTEGLVFYDKCGVKARLTDTEYHSGAFEVENTTSQKLVLSSLYVENDYFTDDSSSIYVTVEPHETAKADLGSFAVLRTRLRLINEDYTYVEGSLSDRITLDKKSLRTLRSAPLVTSVYEDDKIKLSLVRVRYPEEGRTVRPTFFAVNKTDKDIFVSTHNPLCKHEDYTFSFSAWIPAGGRGTVRALASSYNKTITPADLESVTFTMELFNAEDTVGDDRYSAKPIHTTEPIFFSFAKIGIPDYSPPDEIIPAMSEAEFMDELFSDGGPEKLELSCRSSDFDSEFVSMSYVCGAYYPEDGKAEFWFKASNKTDKAVKFKSVGVLNGFTYNFKCRDGLNAMTEDYVSASVKVPAALGTPVSAEMLFGVSYDDSHNDESSVICYSTLFQIGKIGYKAEAPEDAEIICNNGGINVRLLGITESETGAVLSLWFDNLSDMPITVRMAFDDSSKWSIWDELQMFGGTGAVADLRAYRLSGGDDPTDQSLKGQKIFFIISDASGEEISVCEGVL